MAADEVSRALGRRRTTINYERNGRYLFINSEYPVCLESLDIDCTPYQDWQNISARIRRLTALGSHGIRFNTEIRLGLKA